MADFALAERPTCVYFIVEMGRKTSSFCHGTHRSSSDSEYTEQVPSQVMEDLLEEWCVSGGHPYDLDVTSLSVALEQARLKYHAQVF